MVQQIQDFLCDTPDELIDLIKQDLKIEVDSELSQIYDTVMEKFINVSFEDIVKTTVNRIRIAIDTFNTEN